jgi:hypothetical protein
MIEGWGPLSPGKHLSLWNVGQSWENRSLLLYPLVDPEEIRAELNIFSGRNSRHRIGPRQSCLGSRLGDLFGTSLPLCEFGKPKYYSPGS